MKTFAIVIYNDVIVNIVIAFSQFHALLLKYHFSRKLHIWL